MFKMDPSRSTTHPFSRPQPHQVIASDTRFPPIPPSPYSNQPAAPRSDTLHINDPFLRRRSDETNSSVSNQPYTYPIQKAPKYPSGHPSDYSDPAIRDATPQQGGRGSETKYGNDRGDRYSSRLVEGTFLARSSLVL